jgi:uncharacterized HAD superfamily protein
MFDVDGVLADFVFGFTTLANELFGTKIITTPEQVSWNFRTWGLMTKEQENATWDALKQDPYWWARLQSLAPRETFEQINALQVANDVVFATSRVSDVSPPGWQTKRWLRDHGIYSPSVVVTSKKGEMARAIQANFSIEDKLENAWCIHWISDKPQTVSYIINRPYNQLPVTPEIGKALPRVATVDQFLNLITWPKETA